MGGWYLRPTASSTKEMSERGWAHYPRCSSRSQRSAKKGTSIAIVSSSLSRPLESSYSRLVPLSFFAPSFLSFAAVTHQTSPPSSRHTPFSPFLLPSALSCSQPTRPRPFFRSAPLTCHPEFRLQQNTSHQPTLPTSRITDAPASPRRTQYPRKPMEAR